MAVDARSMGAPSRASEIHRRGLLAGLAAIPVLPIAAKASATPTSLEWDVAMREWQAAEREVDEAYALVGNGRATRAQVELLDGLAEVSAEAWARLIRMPAPHCAALCWKVQEIVISDGDGLTASWCENLTAQMREDAKRLSRNG